LYIFSDVQPAVKVDWRQQQKLCNANWEMVTSKVQVLTDHKWNKINWNKNIV